jgi:ABC-2 type transport system ATP-binding protein
MREVGALLEAKPFHPTRRARDHLRMLAAANGISAARVDEVIDLVGLESVARGRPRKFSMGMGQRLGIAAALLGDPHTLLLDEPANGLDPQGIHWLRRLLKHLAGEGRSVFVSSHLLQEMSVLADELVVIGRGRMVANGPVEDFTTASGLGTVEVSSPDLERLVPELQSRGATVTSTDDTATIGGMDAIAIGDLAHELGVRLHQLATRQATLEEAFLSATSQDEEFRGHE